MLTALRSSIWMCACTLCLAGCWSSQDPLLHPEDYFDGFDIAGIITRALFDLPDELVLIGPDGPEVLTRRTDLQIGNGLKGQGTPVYQGSMSSEISILLANLTRGPTFVVQLKQANGRYTYQALRSPRSWAYENRTYPLKEMGQALTQGETLYVQPLHVPEGAGDVSELTRLSALLASLNDASAQQLNDSRTHLQLVARSAISGEEIAAIVAEKDQAYRAARYKRAASAAFLKRCTNGTLLAGGIPAIPNAGGLRVVGEGCRIQALMSTLVLSVADVTDLDCTGDGKLQCRFRMRIACRASSSVANNDLMNDLVCAPFTLGSQPVAATLSDDGKDVVIHSFEMLSR